MYIFVGGLANIKLNVFVSAELEIIFVDFVKQIVRCDYGNQSTQW